MGISQSPLAPYLATLLLQVEYLHQGQAHPRSSLESGPLPDRRDTVAEMMTELGINHRVKQMMQESRRQLWIAIIATISLLAILLAMAQAADDTSLAQDAFLLAGWVNLPLDFAVYLPTVLKGQ